MCEQTDRLVGENVTGQNENDTTHHENENDTTHHTDTVKARTQLQRVMPSASLVVSGGAVADACLLRRRVRGRTAAGAAAGKMESEVLWGPVQRRDVRSWWREGREVC